MNERENARFNELNKKEVRTPEEEVEHKDLHAKKEGSKKDSAR